MFPPPTSYCICSCLISLYLGKLYTNRTEEKKKPFANTFFAIVQPHDAIDFTDNDIQVLGNFPLSPRITTLLLARNRVANIQPTAAAAVPNLRNLVLASNSLAELADVDALGTFTRLTHLVLADNPVTKKEVRFSLCLSVGAVRRVTDFEGVQHYRYWVIWRCPSVRFLDYEKVKQAEREKGQELFGTVEEPTALATSVRYIPCPFSNICSFLCC